MVNKNNQTSNATAGRPARFDLDRPNPNPNEQPPNPTGVHRCSHLRSTTLDVLESSRKLENRFVHDWPRAELLD